MGYLGEMRRAALYSSFGNKTHTEAMSFGGMVFIRPVYFQRVVESRPRRLKLLCKLVVDEH